MPTTPNGIRLIPPTIVSEICFDVNKVVAARPEHSVKELLGKFALAILSYEEHLRDRNNWDTARKHYHYVLFANLPGADKAKTEQMLSELEAHLSEASSKSAVPLANTLKLGGGH